MTLRVRLLHFHPSSSDTLRAKEDYGEWIARNDINNMKIKKRKIIIMRIKNQKLMSKEKIFDQKEN